MKILVTGAAGFIGARLCERLLERGDEVIGVDNLNAYYDVRLKEARLARFSSRPNFVFHKLDIADRQAMASLFANARPQRVMHLAAQAGVRYSLVNPYAYIDANITGFLNMLEGSRHNGVEHLVFASSSSVYGANTRMPFSVHDNVDHPVSLYAATKKSNELMAHAYSHLYQLPVTGLRFFTVYGPWGRPDMSLFMFTRNILEGRPIDVFNRGRHKRDFTYIEDIVEGVIRALDKIATPDPEWSGDRPDPGTSRAAYRLYNIGNNRPVDLLRYIEVLENCLGRKAVRNMLPMQPGDVPETCAEIVDVCAGLRHVARLHGQHVPEGLPAQAVFQHFDVAQQIHRPVVADIVQTIGRAAGARVGPVPRPFRVRRRDLVQRADDAFHDVLDVGEVTLVTAAIEHVDGPALQDVAREHEQRHVGPAPWTVHGEEAQAGHRQLIQMAVGVRHQFVGFLRRRVQRYRMIHIVVHGKRHARVGAVHRAGRGEDKVLDAVVAATLEHIEKAGDVGVNVGVRIDERVAHAGLRGEMHHPLRPGVGEK